MSVSQFKQTEVLQLFLSSLCWLFLSFFKNETLIKVAPNEDARYVKLNLRPFIAGNMVEK